MMAAPLILGNDVRTFLKEDGTVDTENKTYKIVTNRDMIAIDQTSVAFRAEESRPPFPCGHPCQAP